MVKRTYVRMLFRSLWKSKARFLSILAIVAVGAGFLSGLLATKEDMLLTTDTYYDETRLFDINIRSGYGLTEKDISLLDALESTEAVMPARVTDVILSGYAGSYVTRIFGVPLKKRNDAGFVNDFVLSSGRLPEKPNECLLVTGKDYFAEHDIGESYSVSEENEGFENIKEKYAVLNYTVVGLIDFPYHMSIERELSTVGKGSVDMIFLCFEECYSLEVYTDAFVTVAGARQLDTYSSEYKSLISNTENEIKGVGIGQCEIRREEIYDAAELEISNAEAEYTSKRNEAENLLSDAQAKLDEAETLLGDKKAEYEEAAASYESSALLLVSMQNKLDSEIAKAKSELLASKPLMTAEQYEAALAQIEAGRLQSQSKIDEQNKQLSFAKTELDDAKAKIDESEKELDNRFAEYEKNKSDAEKEFSEAEAKLDDARAELNTIGFPEWYVTARSDTTSFKGYESNTDKIGAIARVFPVFFFFVAALVALTTMTRMVEEERVQTGTLKALGFTNGRIMLYYLGFSVAASLVGAFGGVILGMKLLPVVISGAYSMMYNLPETMTPIITVYLLTIPAISVACTTAATLFACVNQLREKPASLLLPRAPKAGKKIFLERISFLWKKMRFSQKVTARNIFRYRKRLYMTVFGIAGCCALLVTGFGLRDSIHDIVEKQFGEIYKYDMTVLLTEGTAVENEDIADFLSESGHVLNHLTTHSENGSAISGEESGNLVIMVPSAPEKLTEQIILRDRKSGDLLQFGTDGIYLTEKLCETLGISAGGEVTLVNGDGKQAVFTVSGICESYVAAYAFIAPALYNEKFGANLEENDYTTVLATLADGSIDSRNAASEALLSTGDVLLVQFSETIRENFENTVESIDYIVIVLIIAAGILAVIVLYNLTNINICERKKELATIKVLGFHNGEVASYIYKETWILTLLGIIVGFVLGSQLHSFVVRTAEVDAVMFGRTANASSYLLAAAVTVLFAALVDIVMLAKLKEIDMVESMKANE